MEQLPLLIYLAGLVDSLKLYIGIITAVGSVYTALAFSIIPATLADSMYISFTEAIKITKAKATLIIILIISGISALLPTSRTIYLMMGASAASQLAQSETGTKVLTLLNAKLDTAITDELTPPTTNTAR